MSSFFWWKLRKFTLTEKILRQITYLLISIAFTNFSQTCVEVNSPHCGNYGNLLSLFFGKNFVKVMVLLTKLLNSWFDEKKNGESTFFIFPQCALSLFWQKFRESNVFTSKRSYCVANFTKYFYGEWERICVFSVFYEFSREINLYKVKLLYLISRIFP